VRGERRRVEGGLRGRTAADVDRHGARPVLGELVEQVRDLARDARADQDDVHAREHRSVDRRRGGRRELLREVDPDEAAVALLGEPDLDEAADDGQLVAVRVRPYPGPEHRDVRHRVVALGAQVALDDATRHVREREVRDGATHVATRVAVLEPAGEQDVEPGPGDHAQLPGARDRVGQPPRGHDARAAVDAALDDGRQSCQGCGSHRR